MIIISDITSSFSVLLSLFQLNSAILTGFIFCLDVSHFCSW